MFRYLRLPSITTSVTASRITAARFVARSAASRSAVFPGASSTAPPEGSKADAVLVGVYQDRTFVSEFGSSINEKLDRKLSAALNMTTKPLKRGELIYLVGAHPEYPRVVAVSCGKKTTNLEQVDRGEICREAAANGVRTLKQLGATHALLDPLLDNRAVSEGAHLSLYKYTEFKKTKPESNSDEDAALDSDKPLYLESALARTENESGIGQWNGGKLLADAQNFARDLMNAPSNVLTPSEFVQRVRSRLQDLPHVRIFERDEDWVRQQQMNLFHGVARGSNQPLRFLEVHYLGHSSAQAEAPQRPMVFVGKGITFDSGGIDIKPSNNMWLMKGDMGGAATVMSATAAIAALGLPEDVVALAPLCENMPSGNALKPGDILRAMDGTTVEIDNTDAEGRLILADALTYAQRFEPQAIVDVATLTGAIEVALGKAYFGFFTNSQDLHRMLTLAMQMSGELGWRMPLSEEYLPQLKSSVADLLNCSRERGAGACTAAVFLKHFVGRQQPWLHLDIAGVMEAKRTAGHQVAGMTGVPTRTLVQLVIAHFMKSTEARQMAELEADEQPQPQKIAVDAPAPRLQIHS